MDGEFWFNVVMRWMHVSAAVVAVGALVVMRFVVLPGAEAAGPEASGAVSASLRRGFQRLMHIAVGLLLLTGFYNFYRILPRVNALGDLKSTYHMVIGLKILLAFAFFGVATGWMASRRAGRIQPMPLAIGIALAVVILFLSATLRRTWDLQPGP